MVETLFIDDTEVKVNVRKINFSKLGYDFDGSDNLVYYSDDGTVIVDERADDTYTKYASIHEAICQGPYKNLAPACDNPNCRCLEIDKMIIGLMSKDKRNEYIEKRISMFNNLLDKNISPELNDIFKESLEGLKKI